MVGGEKKKNELLLTIIHFLAQMDYERLMEKEISEKKKSKLAEEKLFLL